MPLYHGLQEFLRINEKQFYESVLDYSLNLLPSLPSLHNLKGRTSNPPWQPAGSAMSFPSQATLFFDTAGTGKSIAAQEMVRKNFGFYCLPPNLPPPDVKIDKSVIAPDRACASRDTFSLYDDLRAFEKASPDWNPMWEGLEPSLITAPLHAARIHALEVFNDLVQGDQAEIKWFQLQTSCWPGNDPFDAAYRLNRLQSRWKTSDIEKEQLSSVADRRAKVWAVDEAQCALDNPLAVRILTEILLGKFDVCLSGTSLELREMEKFVVCNVFLRPNTYSMQESYVLTEKNFWETMRSYAWNIIREVHALQSRTVSQPSPEDFPLVSRGGKPLGFTIQLPRGDWDEAKDLLRQWHIFKETSHTDSPQDKRNFDEFIGQVKKSHITFLGRVRWTTLFAEELLRLSPETMGKLTPEQVEIASQNAAEIIKSSLKARIDQHKHTDWMSELYWTAIEADVFSMSRIFPDEDSVKLISMGFALVHRESEHQFIEGGTKKENVIVKGYLKEPLAVKAVMEYLREPKNGGLYDKLMNRFFTCLQLDRGEGGGLGKMAEFVFTAVSTYLIFSASHRGHGSHVRLSYANGKSIR